MKKVSVFDLEEGRYYKSTPNESTKWRCENLRRRYYYRVYEDSGARQFYSRKGGLSTHFVYLCEEEENNQEENNMSTQLMQIKGSEVYGTILAHNSKGMCVFEERGNGKIHTVKPEDLEEVIPYSVGVKLTGESQKTFHCWAKEGSVKVGDLILTNRLNLVVVTEIDTKNKTATKWLDGKVLAVASTIGEDE